MQITGNGTAGDADATSSISSTVPAAWLDLQEKPVNDIGRPVAIERLIKLRGGSDSSDSIVVLDGGVSGNTAEDVFSGSNHIDNGFNNANGITTVIQNTGNNVLIQSGVAVSVLFTD